MSTTRRQRVFKVGELDLTIILFCAFHYAVGRKAPVPKRIQEILKRFGATLSSAMLNSFIDRIEASSPDELGDQGDTWRAFANWCRNELKGARLTSEDKTPTCTCTLEQQFLGNHEAPCPYAPLI